MSDFIKQLCKEDAPEKREVKIGDSVGDVYFRKITGGEKEQLVKGMKITSAMGKMGSMEIDLMENERQRHLLILFSVCNETGQRIFKDVDEVKKLSHQKLSVLSWHAEEVNRDDQEMGKPLGKTRGSGDSAD